MSDTVRHLDKELVINVRSPSLNETLTVTIKLKSTILSLKECIRPIHPHQPAAENQRIIYSGKLLQDNELLSDIIKAVDDEVTPIFHLVVKPSLQSMRPKQQPPNTLPQTTAAANNISTPSTSLAPLSESNTNSFNNSSSSSSSSSSNQFVQNNNINVPAYPSVLPGGYQVVLINGNYYLAPVLVASQPFYDPLHHLQPNTASSYQQYPQPPQPQAPEPIIQHINLIPQQNNNAAGAPVLVRPANAQRATSIWLALKLVVVLFMVCQGASIERIIIFHTIAFIFFLYQTGRLRFVLRRVRIEDINVRGGNAAPAPAQRPPTQAPQQQQQQATGSSTAANNNTDGLNQRRMGNAAAVTSSSSSSTTTTPPTFLDVCKRGAYTFFASLWPTYGQDPRIAQAFENINDQREGV